MRILYINPNSTSSMTEAVVTCARKVLPADCEVLGWTNHQGPPAIQGPADGEAALPGLLAQLGPARAAGVDAIIIACFDDTGLEVLRTAADCPVFGIGQAAYSMAALLGGPFSVVTTLAVSVPVIAGNIARQGFTSQCAAVRPTGLPVLEVEAGGARVLERIGQQIALAASEDGAKIAILGCAGMSAHYHDIARTAALPVIDGVRASALFASAALAHNGLSRSASN